MQPLRSRSRRGGQIGGGFLQLYFYAMQDPSPVDGMSSEDAYNEQYAAWHIYKGGPQVLRRSATLTRSDLIKFGS
jgi:hypothetical protein